MKKYKVWFSIDQAFEVKAESEEKAKEMVLDGQTNKIIEERNQEWLETEEIEERSCVKCGKTSCLIEEKDMCYTCAKERGRI